MAKIPDGWTYCTTELSEEAAWDMAVRLKTERERLRPGLLVRVRVVPGFGRGRGSYWVLRKDDTRVKETAS
jgi:hypothetical protein